MQVQNEIDKVTMHKSNNPKGIIKRLQVIKIKYDSVPGVGMNEQLLVTHMTTIVLQAYSSTITTVAMNAKAIGRDEMLKELKKELGTQYAVLSQGCWESTQDEVEHGLTIADDQIKPVPHPLDKGM